MEETSGHSSNIDDASSPSALTGRRWRAQRHAQAEAHLR